MPVGTWIRKNNNDLVVVFIHGLISNEECWRNQNGTYWPDLLETAKGLSSIGIYLFAYKTSFSSGNYSIGDAVDSLKEYLDLDKVINYPQILFVCHSMGGIIARRFIVSRHSYLLEKGLKEVGLFLVASPSLGSKYPNFLSQLVRIAGHTQVQSLMFSQSNTWLNDLDKDFINLKHEGKLSITGKELIEDNFVFLKKIIKEQIVPPFSGARYFPDSIKIPNSDHFSIARPDSRDAFQHQLLLKFISTMRNKHIQEINDQSNLGRLEKELKTQLDEQANIPKHTNVTSHEHSDIQIDKSSQKDLFEIIKQIQLNNTSNAIRILERVDDLESSKSKIVKLCLKLIDDSDILLGIRIKAAEILGKRGDPRIPLSIQDWEKEGRNLRRVYGITDSYWCFIRGEFWYWIGESLPKDRNSGILIQNFWIAKYPVTNAQFRLFIKDGGYHDTHNKYWSPNGIIWKNKMTRVEPKRWNTITQEDDNRPVTNVSWYEANAFANWLDEKIEAFLPEEYIVRIPTEAEWEAAAFFDNSPIPQWRPYPWGKIRPTPNLAIYDECGLTRPAPVGCCPSGRALSGALDLVGNTFEIMSNDFKKHIFERNDRERDFPEGRDNIVPWRGGSYDSKDSWLESTQDDRYARSANADNSHTGFRLALILGSRETYD